MKKGSIGFREYLYTEKRHGESILRTMGKEIWVQLTCKVGWLREQKAPSDYTGVIEHRVRRFTLKLKVWG